MNKKLFKRLLIASGLIAPVVMITPMILTSCNDNSTNNPGDEKLISLGSFNKLLKTRPVDPNIKDSPNEFWLDIIDFHGNSFSGSDKNTNYPGVNSQIRKFYFDLMNNKKSLVETKLIGNDKFKYVLKTGDKEEEITDVSKINYNEKIILRKSGYTKDDNLSTIFNNLLLSNIVDGPSIDENVGIITNWNSLPWDTLIDQIDIKSEIVITDIKPVAKDETAGITIDDIKNSSKYTVKYWLTPKNGYQWKNVEKGNEGISLVVTLDDQIDTVEIVNDLEKVKDNVNIGNITPKYVAPSGGSNGKFEFTFPEISLSSPSITDNDTLVKEIEKNLGLADSKLSSITSGGSINLMDVDNLLGGVNNFTFLNYLDSVNENTKTFLNLDNTKSKLENERISANVSTLTKGTDNASPTASLEISFLLEKIKDQSLPYFSWFFDFMNDTENKITADIVLKLSFKKA